MAAMETADAAESGMGEDLSGLDGILARIVVDGIEQTGDSLPMVNSSHPLMNANSLQMKDYAPPKMD
eukprot:9481986-Alexandrium_andersonii.AAC.1